MAKKIAIRVTVDHQKAYHLLYKLVQTASSFNPQNLSKQHRDAIRAIILGDHLTFRYMLITSLLAKVVEPAIHMRALQANARLHGAYDARSLCHKVWVPFERKHLESRLGGSNEPYLNKPARFPSIEKTNAVRAGRDRDLLYTLYDLLESLNAANRVIHREALLFAIGLVMTRGGGVSADLPLQPITFSAHSVEAFRNAYLRLSHGGEVPVSVIGAILSTRYTTRDYDVKVHPVNQAGTSSNEVGDIDVYLRDTVTLPVEVKDKLFGAADIEHAVKKAQRASCHRLLFVSGRQASPAKNVHLKDVASRYALQGFDLAFVSIDTLVQCEVPLLSESDRRKLIQHIHRHLVTMRAKDETKRHFKDQLKKLGFTH